MPLKHLQTLNGHSDRVWTLAWNYAGTVLASSGGDKKIKLWANEGDKWQCVAILEDSHEKTIRRICWSPCGNYIASASFDSTICVWKMNSSDKSWSSVYNLEGHESEVKSVAWSSNGKFLATCGRDKVVWIWERATNEDVGDNKDDEQEDSAKLWDCSDIKNDHTKDVKHIVWHPKEDILASCSYDDTVKMFYKDDEDWKCYQTLSSHTSTIWSADFSRSGEFLVTCSDDKTVRIWQNFEHNKLPSVEPNSWKCVSVIQGYHTRTIYDVSWNKSTDVIVSGSGDNSLVFYRKSNGQSDQLAHDLYTCIEKNHQSHDCDINVVSWNPTQPNLLATGSDDRSIKIWDYVIPNEGMSKPMNVVDEIMSKLESLNTDIKSVECQNQQNVDVQQQQQQQSMTFKISEYTNLLTLIQFLQNLQNEICSDRGLYHSLELAFNLDIEDPLNPKPVEIDNLIVDDNGIVEEFQINIVDKNGSSTNKFRFIIDKLQFKLTMPRRSLKLLIVASELFLYEKTGDMYKIIESGESLFQLGHLFTFADVKFITNDKFDKICRILSADRDEKIRISNYPDTFNIERFCFGHKSFIKRLIIVDVKRFISIDQDDNAALWNLTDLGQDDNTKPLKPEKTISMIETVTKRVRA